jgi:hypothetical protein
VRPAYQVVSLRRKFRVSLQQPALHACCLLGLTLGTPDTDSDPEDSPQYNPALRATSEPPPDLDLDISPERTYSAPRRKVRRPSAGSTHTITAPKHKGRGLAVAVPPAPGATTGPDADYLWEWGAFPTPSPRVDAFSASAARRRAARPGPGVLPEWDRARSSPRVTGPPGEAAILVRDAANAMWVGASASGSTLWLELSVLPEAPDLERMGDKGVLNGLDAVQAVELFARGALSYDRVLEDPSLLLDPRLVLRLGDER